MFRRAALALFASLVLAVGHAGADSLPDAAKVRVAADQFEVGALAYKKNAYEEAASAFEAADAAVPSAKPLRLAIRSRDLANQGSRAATLAELALSRYPKDAELVELARKTIQKLAPALHKVVVTCAAPCVLANGTRAIHGAPDTHWVVYVDPGPATFSASFVDRSENTQKSIVATAGGSSEIHFDSKPSPPPSGEAPSRSASVSRAPATAGRDSSRTGLSPGFFMTGVVVTVGLLGTTIWSGIDTMNNPGADAVRAACAGRDETCPEYQAGRSHQMRTNVLLGATIGTAAVTGLIGAVFTQWHGAAGARPSAMVLDRGAAGAITGQF
jgi:hypothetical protein